MRALYILVLAVTGFVALVMSVVSWVEHQDHAAIGWVILQGIAVNQATHLVHKYRRTAQIDV